MGKHWVQWWFPWGPLKEQLSRYEHKQQQWGLWFACDFAYVCVHPSDVGWCLRPERCWRLVLVCKCPHEKLNHSAEGILGFPWVLWPCCTVSVLMPPLLLLSSVSHTKVLSFPNSTPLLEYRLKPVTLMLFHFLCWFFFVCLFPCFGFSLWLWFLRCVGNCYGSSAQTLLLVSDLKQNKREREKGGDCLLVTEQLVPIKKETNS